MPHAELKYSTDLIIDTKAILAEIETVILEHDGSAGACKGRGYPTSHYHHSHIAVSVTLLTKPHRDSVFSQSLLSELERRIKALISGPCEFSLGLTYAQPFYVTCRHQP